MNKEEVMDVHSIKIQCGGKLLAQCSITSVLRWITKHEAQTSELLRLSIEISLDISNPTRERRFEAPDVPQDSRLRGPEMRFQVPTPLEHSRTLVSNFICMATLGALSMTKES